MIGAAKVAAKIGLFCSVGLLSLQPFKAASMESHFVTEPVFSSQSQVSRYISSFESRLTMSGRSEFASVASIQHSIAQFSSALVRNGAVSFASVPSIASQLQNAATDVPRNKPLHGSDCFATPTDSTVANPCVYTTSKGAKSVVLFGDSHAQQWLNTLVAVATSRHWTLISLLRAGCGAAQSQSNTYPPYSTQQPKCQAWRSSALTWIHVHHPALILFSSDIDGLPWKTGDIGSLEATLDATLIADVGAPNKTSVVSIVDTMGAYYGGFGHNSLTTSGCLSREGLKATYAAQAATSTYQNDPIDCYRVYSNDVFDVPLVNRNALVSADQATGISIVDPRSWICDTTPVTGLCPPVIDGTVVYRDQSHLTASFTARLAAVMASAIPTA